MTAILDNEFVLEQARSASADVGLSTLDAYGDKGDCGSAWVVIRPARGPFVKFLKAQGIGEKHFNGGWKVNVCNGLKRHTQCRIVFEKACDAYVAVLEAYGINAFTYSYAD